MLGISHILLGAAIGKQINNPALALGAGIASHLIVDKIPHFWPKTKLNQNKQIILDIFGSVLIFVIFIFWPLPNKVNIFWGAFGGGLVDLIFVIGPMLFPKFKDNSIRVWHEERQYHFHKPVYLLSDILLSMISLALILV